MRCGWPADRSRFHRTMDHFSAVKTDAGTASFLNIKKYQKMNRGAGDLEEDQQDLYTEESCSEETRDPALEDSLSESSETSLQAAENWWESD